MAEKFKWLAGAAGALALVSFTSILWRVYQTKDTNALTWEWVLINLLAQTLYYIYSLANQLYGLIVPSTVFIIGLLYVLWVKIMYPSAAPTNKNALNNNQQNPDLST